MEIKETSYYNFKPSLSTFKENCLPQAIIQLDNVQSEKAKQTILEAHRKYGEVFNKDLKKGYNGAYGTHLCKLNWATKDCSKN